MGDIAAETFAQFGLAGLMFGYVVFRLEKHFAEGKRSHAKQTTISTLMLRALERVGVGREDLDEIKQRLLSDNGGGAT